MTVYTVFTDKVSTISIKETKWYVVHTLDTHIFSA